MILLLDELPWRDRDPAPERDHVLLTDELLRERARGRVPAGDLHLGDRHLRLARGERLPDRQHRSAALDDRPARTRADHLDALVDGDTACEGARLDQDHASVVDGVGGFLDGVEARRVTHAAHVRGGYTTRRGRDRQHAHRQRPGDQRCPDLRHLFLLVSLYAYPTVGKEWVCQVGGEKCTPITTPSFPYLSREIEGSRLHYWLPTSLVPTFCGTRFWASTCSWEAAYQDYEFWHIPQTAYLWCCLGLLAGSELL